VAYDDNGIGTVAYATASLGLTVADSNFRKRTNFLYHLRIPSFSVVCVFH